MARRGGARLAGAVASAVTWVVGTLSTTAVATHVAGHNYSAAYENSSFGNYTGVKVYRWDRDIPVPGVCNAQFAAPVVYQTQWVVMLPSAASWIELGTMHKQSSCKYWYWGYGLNGVWVPVGTVGGIVADDHTFQIVRAADGIHWLIFIDSTLIDQQIAWAAAGAFVEAGLESYVPTITISAHGYYNMQWNQGGIWRFFGGRDASSVTGPMCGRWITDDDWQAGQNTTCV